MFFVNSFGTPKLKDNLVDRLSTTSYLVPLSDLLLKETYHLILLLIPMDKRSSCKYVCIMPFDH